MLVNKIKTFFRSPFASEKQLIVHACYHRCMTVYMQRVFNHIANYYGLSVRKTLPADILFSDHSMNIPDGPLRGSHMVRDPRDMIVSSYFYHLKTSEKWCHIPLGNYEDQSYNTYLLPNADLTLSYQQYLHTLPQHDGLLVEIRRFIQHEWPYMVNWNYNDERFIELRYEDVLKDPNALEPAFKHYGFDDRAIKLSLNAAWKHSIQNRKDDKHITSGRLERWREILTPDHLDYIKSNIDIKKIRYE